MIAGLSDGQRRKTGRSGEIGDSLRNGVLYTLQCERHLLRRSLHEGTRYLLGYPKKKRWLEAGHVNDKDVASASLRWAFLFFLLLKRRILTE